MAEPSMEAILRRYMLSLALLSCGAVSAHAQQPGPNAGISINGAPAADQSMMESMNKMNQAMSSAPMTGDPDHDFVVMMIPHHQGATEMARYELRHGKDTEMRKLAQAIVAAQDKEIAEMKRWLARHKAK